MFSETWGAFALASGMWIIASIALIAGDTAGPSRSGTVWTASSSDKVASHPTLVRRSLPGPSGVRTAALSVAP
jgi:hypothetical protein